MKSNTKIEKSMIAKMSGINKYIVSDLMDCYEEVIYNCEIKLTEKHSIYSTYGCRNENILTHIFVFHYNDDLILDIIRQAHLYGFNYRVIVLGPGDEVPNWINEEHIDRNYQEMLVC